MRAFLAVLRINIKVAQEALRLVLRQLGGRQQRGDGAVQRELSARDGTRRLPRGCTRTSDRSSSLSAFTTTTSLAYTFLIGSPVASTDAADTGAGRLPYVSSTWRT